MENFNYILLAIKKVFLYQIKNTINNVFLFTTILRLNTLKIIYIILTQN